MTAPRAKLAPMLAELEKTTEAARCAKAEAMFEDTKVKAALMAAADLARTVCVFHPVPPFDPRGTPAADRIEEWAKKASLQVRWTDPVPVLEQGIEVGQSRALVVSWEASRIPIA